MKNLLGGIKFVVPAGWKFPLGTRINAACNGLLLNSKRFAQVAGRRTGSGPSPQGRAFKINKTL
jgi:hypothetical protein